MAREIKADHSQIFLLPPDIETWVSADHPVRFIRAFVSSLNLKGLGFRVRHQGESGADSYSAEMMLGIWIYGYYNRVYSSRRLEAACKNEMPLIWLTGMHYPDHNSLWRFWRSNQKAIKGLLKQSVLTADKLGMIGMVTNAVDGTKIQVVSSRRTSWNKTCLENKLKSIESSIARMEEQIQKSEKTEECEEVIPKRLQDAKAMKESIQQALSGLKELEKKNHHPNEPEAAMMKNGRVLELSYNAQVGVDATNKIIVAATVTNDENDKEQMVPMLDAIKENKGETATETLFDTGYDSVNQLAKAEVKNYSVLVNDQEKRSSDKNSLHPSHFKYDESQNTMLCPEGTYLQFERIKENYSKNVTVKLFRCKNQNCHLRPQCTQEKAGRSIEVRPHRGALDRQNIKRHSVKGRETLRKRGQIVEPIFAFIKSNSGFKRFLYRGLEKAKVQWIMLCTVENLKRIVKISAQLEPKPS